MQRRSKINIPNAVDKSRMDSLRQVNPMTEYLILPEVTCTENHVEHRETYRSFLSPSTHIFLAHVFRLADIFYEATLRYLTISLHERDGVTYEPL